MKFMIRERVKVIDSQIVGEIVEYQYKVNENLKNKFEQITYKVKNDWNQRCEWFDQQKLEHEDPNNILMYPEAVKRVLLEVSLINKNETMFRHLHSDGANA